MPESFNIIGSVDYDRLLSAPLGYFDVLPAILWAARMYT